jgi:hypothetical protein
MPLDDEFTTILAISQNQNNLIMRLDISDWFVLKSYEDVVCEISLIECSDVQKSFEEIKKHIGEFVWNYEFSQDEKIFTILLDDGEIIEIECNEIKVKKQDLTIDELLQKFQILAKSYQQESERSSKGWRKYQQLNQLLKREVLNEIQNWERKKEFFEKTNPHNAEKAKAAIKFCERIINFVRQIEEENA